MKSPLSSTVVFLICALFAFAASVRAQDIVIGEFASLTGSEATFGINSSNGVELAKEEINNAGGMLGGRKIKIVIEDDQIRRDRGCRPLDFLQLALANQSGGIRLIAVLQKFAGDRCASAVGKFTQFCQRFFGTEFRG